MPELEQHSNQPAPHDAPPPPGVEFCPVTGMPITSRHEWENIQVGKNYFVSFRFIGDRILHSIANGDSSTLDADILSRKRGAVLKQYIGDGNWFIEIKDYSHATGIPSRKVRAQSFEKFVDDQMCAGFVGYGLRSTLARLMKLGYSAAPKIYPFELRSTYEQAVERALELVDAAEYGRPLNSKYLISRPDWHYDDGIATAHYSVIPGLLMHLTIGGFLDSDAATDWLLATHKRMYDEGMLNSDHYYRIVDYSDAWGSKWRVRWTYARGLRQLYEEYGKPRAIVIAGASRLLEATVNSVRSLVGVKLRFVRTTEQAFKHVQLIESNNDPTVPTKEPGLNRFQRLIKRFRSLFRKGTISTSQIDEIVDVLGCIAWDTGEGSVPKVGPNHPLRTLYDSIDLVKQDVEHSVSEKNKSREALRESEAQLRKHRDELEELIAERTSNLWEANAELKASHSRMVAALAREREITERLEIASRQAEDATRAKTAFLANMSHEIRTPMTAIMGFTENLLDPDLSPSDRLNAIYTIRRNGDHLLQLINDILDISKIEAGKLEIERIDCCPIELVTEVHDLMSVRASSKGLEFNIEFSGPIPTKIQTDPTRLRQILVNLIGNAIKFTEEGEIRLLVQSVKKEDRKQDPTATEHNLLQFDIIDTGIGLTNEQLARLFRPFTQADSSMTRKFGGTGLGLMISKRLAFVLGGDITVENTSAEGSCFRFTVATGSLQDVEMRHNPSMATKTILHTPADVTNTPLHCRILLAEDGPDNQRLISYMLKKAGADVTIVENGKLAVDTALAVLDQSQNGNDAQQFDVILMDMQMPVLDGYKATALLRKKGYKLPIIALTAHAMVSDRQKCLEAGCDDYATKPINRDKMIKMILRHLPASEAVS